MADTTHHIMVKNARVSFPHFFTKPTINGEEGSFGGRLLLDPKEHKDVIAKIEKHIEDIVAEKFKKTKIPSDKRCLRNGDDLTRPEYEGYMVVSANSQKQPKVYPKTGDLVPITDEAQSKIYSGCRVNMKINLWAQDNNFGKRVNAECLAVQFAGDDEPLDGTHVSDEEAAEGFETADDDDEFLS